MAAEAIPRLAQDARKVVGQTMRARAADYTEPRPSPKDELDRLRSLEKAIYPSALTLTLSRRERGPL
jgi:hypothetical protein